jgi:hypothetical protein
LTPCPTATAIRHARGAPGRVRQRRRLSRLLGPSRPFLGTIAAVSLLGAFTSCGSSEPLEDADAKPQAIIDAWSEVVCNGVSVKDVDASELDGDSVAASYCDLEGNGTLEQKRQYIRVLDTPAAEDTYMRGRDCGNYLYVAGPTWVAVGLVREVATDLVEAGGELYQG